MTRCKFSRLRRMKGLVSERPFRWACTSWAPQGGLLSFPHSDAMSSTVSSPGQLPVCRGNLLCAGHKWFHPHSNSNHAAPQWGKLLHLTKKIEAPSLEGTYEESRSKLKRPSLWVTFEPPLFRTVWASQQGQQTISVSSVKEFGWAGVSRMSWVGPSTESLSHGSSNA